MHHIRFYQFHLRSEPSLTMWYYQKNDAAEGPLDQQQVLDLMLTGSISRETPVWTEGMPDWLSAEDTALSEYFRSVPPPIKRASTEQPSPISPNSSVSEAARTEPSGFRNPLSLTNWLTALLAISLLFGLVAIWSSSEQFDLLERIRRHQQVTIAEAEASDARQQVVGIVQFIIFIVTTIVFGRWIYIVAHNVRVLGAKNLQFTPGWAVGYYFIPFANIYKPYRAMKEIWKASRDPQGWQKAKGSFILRFWWTFWILSCAAGQMAMRTSLSPKNQYNSSDAVMAALFSDVIDIPLCFFSILLIRNIAKRQVATASSINEL